MARYISDQNKVVFLYESGTYGVTSGAASTAQWIGEVTEHSAEDNENLLVDRYLGASTRSVSQWVGGPRDINGTLTYHPQDMRFFFWAIGSINDNGAAGHYTHYANQVNTNAWQNPFCSGTGQLNAPKSFGLEDSKTTANGSVFLRTIKGCVIDSATLTASQGEKVTCEINYLAQNLTYSGGTSSLGVTALTNTPYLWSNCSLVLSGTTISTAKEVSLEIANNLEGPHYLNGSRDISAPIPGNRDNTLSVTMDLDSSAGTLLYSLYKNNASFNGTFTMDASTATGSQLTVIFMSGCKVNSMEVPSTNEGVVESTVEIVCPTLIGSACDNVAKYNPW